MTSPGQEPTPTKVTGTRTPKAKSARHWSLAPIDDESAVSPTLQERAEVRRMAEHGFTPSADEVLVLLERIDSLEAQLAAKQNALEGMTAHATEGWKLAATRASEWKRAEKEREALEHALNVTAEQYETERGLVATAHRIVREQEELLADTAAEASPDLRGQFEYALTETRATLRAFAAAGITEPEEPT